MRLRATFRFRTGPDGSKPILHILFVAWRLLKHHDPQASLRVEHEPDREERNGRPSP